METFHKLFPVHPPWCYNLWYLQRIVGCILCYIRLISSWWVQSGSVSCWMSWILKQKIFTILSKNVCHHLTLYPAALNCGFQFPKSVKIFLFITQIFYCFENRQILNFDSVTFRITPNAPGQANQPYTDCYLWLWLIEYYKHSSNWWKLEYVTGNETGITTNDDPHMSYGGKEVIKKMYEMNYYVLCYADIIWCMIVLVLSPPYQKQCKVSQVAPSAE